MVNRVRVSALVVSILYVGLGPRMVVADEAKELYKEAVAAFEAERYDEAARLFEDAYQARPSWRLMFNIAQSLAAAKDFGRALTTFERYLAEGGDEISEGRMNEVLKEMDRLRKLVGYVTVKAPDGQTVRVDGIVRGTTPLSADIPVSIGVEHRFEVGNSDPVVRVVRVRSEATSILNVMNATAPTIEEQPTDSGKATDPGETEQVCLWGTERR